MLIQLNLFYRVVKSPAFYFLLFNLYCLLRNPFSYASVGLYAMLFIGISAYFLASNFKIANTLIYYITVLFVISYESLRIIFYEGNIAFYSSVFFRNVNLFAAFIVCIFFNLSTQFTTTKKPVFFLIPCLVVLAILIYLECRAAIISVIIGLVIVIVDKWKSFSTITKTTLAILLFSTSFFCLVLMNKKINSVTGRLFVYQAAILKNTNQFFGYGGNSFEGKFPTVLRNYIIETDNVETKLPISSAPQYAFNEFIQLYFEYGLLGCVLLTFILLPIFKVFFYKQNKAILAPLISLLINAFFSYTFHNIILYALFVISLASVHRLFFKERQPFLYERRIMSISILILVFGLTCGFIYRVNENSRITLSKNSYNACNTEVIAKYQYLLPFYQNKPYFIAEYSNFLVTNCVDTAKATKILLSSISINPEYNTLLSVGEIYYYSNDYSNAEKYFKKAHEFMPNRFIAMDFLLNLSIKRNDSLQAKLYAEKIIKNKVNVNSPFVNLAKINAQTYINKANHNKIIRY